MAKEEISALDKVLIETIQKAQEVGGQAVDGAKEVTGKAIDFATAQIPDVIHQLLLWNFTISLILFLVSAVVFFGTVIFDVVAVRRFLSGKWDGEYFPILIITALPISLGLLGLLANLEWLKIWIAPKLFLIEYTANLLK